MSQISEGIREDGNVSFYKATTAPTMTPTAPNVTVVHQPERREEALLLDAEVVALAAAEGVADSVRTEVPDVKTVTAGDAAPKIWVTDAVAEHDDDEGAGCGLGVTGSPCRNVEVP